MTWQHFSSAIITLLFALLVAVNLVPLSSWWLVGIGIALPLAMVAHGVLLATRGQREAATGVLVWAMIVAFGLSIFSGDVADLHAHFNDCADEHD